MSRTTTGTKLGIAVTVVAALASTWQLGEWRGAARAAPAPPQPGATGSPRGAMPPPGAAPVDAAISVSRTFAQVASQVGASVVRISVSKKGDRQSPFAGTPFEHFFGQEGQGRPAPRQRGLGSGVVFDSAGHILTNNHVIEGAEEVKVTFIDGRTLNGKIVGADPKTDLAVVKVDGAHVTPARLGDSNSVAVGEWVIAIGNPFGLDHTVTVGVLSAKNRSGFESGQYEDFLQTDASINLGNSGGPLVNLRGEVIGINTAIAGMGTGIGFAVPTSMARPIVDQLVRSGRVRRPYLGIFMQDLTPDLQRSLGARAPDRGALVSKIEPRSPADKAGLKDGDVITALDGSPVDGSHAVQRSVLTHGIGDKIQLSVWRDGSSRTMTVMAAELPEGAGGKRASKGGGAEPHDRGAARLGMVLQTLTPDLAAQLGMEQGQKGAVIAGVHESGPAAEAGLSQGDVIVEIDRKPVASAEEAVRLLGAQRGGGHLLRVRRGDAMLFVPLP